MRAKTSGDPVPETIVTFVQTHHAHPDCLGTVLDIGCDTARAPWPSPSN